MIATEKQKKEARSFYKESLELLDNSGIEYLLGGGFALFHYTNIYRDTKDLDIFCRPRDYSKILKYFGDLGFRTELTDARWLAKVFKETHYVDIIFDTPNTICTVDDTWFQHATMGDFDGHPVKVIPPEELIWCKIYVQNRERFDGADVNHLILRYGRKLDWKRLLMRLDNHWHIFLAQLLMFQFVYPGDYHTIIPQWLFGELLARAQAQYDVPHTMEKICRGPIIDQTQYSVDIKEWDYKVFTMRTV